jgi:hypothetical protein
MPAPRAVPAPRSRRVSSTGGTTSRPLWMPERDLSGSSMPISCSYRCWSPSWEVSTHVSPHYHSSDQVSLSLLSLGLVREASCSSVVVVGVVWQALGVLGVLPAREACSVDDIGDNPTVTRPVPRGRGHVRRVEAGRWSCRVGAGVGGPGPRNGMSDARVVGVYRGSGPATRRVRTETGSRNGRVLARSERSAGAHRADQIVDALGQRRGQLTGAEW